MQAHRICADNQQVCNIHIQTQLQTVIIKGKHEITETTKERQKRQRILEHKLFFGETLPKSYVKPNALLQISKYPFAWFYNRNTAKETQTHCPLGPFRLPQGNLYTKGTNAHNK